MDWVAYYENAWTVRARILEGFVNEETDLARVFGRFDRFEARQHYAAPAGGEGGYVPVEGLPDPLGRLEAIIHGVSCGGPAPLSAYVDLNVGRLLADLGTGADIIAEIGSGYGRQLFDLWLAGGGDAQTRFIGYEPNRSGRDSAALLAKLVPGMSLELMPGDFATFDPAPLAEAGRVLLFTHFAVMFPQLFPADFFSKVAAVPGEVLLCVIEPLGGQIGRDDLELDHNFNIDFMRRFNEAAAAGLIEPLYIGRDLFGRADRITHVSVIVAVKPARAGDGVSGP
jgi:hypothetical protein